MTTTEADAPFNASARADVILRSSDQIDFHTLKAFLSYASPVFESMLSSKQLPKKLEDARTIIDIHEEAKFVRILLLFCLPGRPPLIKNDDDLIYAIQLSERYSMSIMEVELHRQLLASPIVLEHPLRIFAIAYHHGWEDIGTFAAQQTLAFRVEQLPFYAELTYLSGMQMHQLSHYRHRTKERVRTWMGDNLQYLKFDESKNPPEEFIWWQRGSPHSGWQCEEKDIEIDYHDDDDAQCLSTQGRSWWTLFFSAFVQRLSFCQGGRLVLESDFFDGMIAVITLDSHCPTCTPVAREHVVKFRYLLAQAIDKVISETPLGIDFDKGENFFADGSDNKTIVPLLVPMEVL